MLTPLCVIFFQEKKSILKKDNIKNTTTELKEEKSKLNAPAEFVQVKLYF